MQKKELIRQIHRKKSFLCIGLDTDRNKIPRFLALKEDGILEFNQRIIDTTHPYCIAYKINLAFYEALGIRGWEIFRQTVEYIPDDIFVIADAKRGDIGNTSKMYARAFFENMDCDAITLSPYMGEDSIRPFMEFSGKWSIILGLTSNTGSLDFQQLSLARGGKVYEAILRKASSWGTDENTMFVVGATHPEEFKKIRLILPEHFLLVPGIGAQGGSLEEVCKHGLNRDVGLIVNSSRGIIYAGSDKDFAERAAEKAREVQTRMSEIITFY